MLSWACHRCDTLHTQNPEECRSCGHGIFRPVGQSELSERSVGGKSPEPYTVDATTGTTKKGDIESSPDVRPDGSINRKGKSNELLCDEDRDSRQGDALLSRLVSLVR